jgi:hypothetical protein
LQAIQRLCPGPHDEGQLYGDRYGVTVQRLLAPGRFDRSSAISQKPEAQSCVAIRSKPDGQGPKGFGVDGSRCRLSAPHRAPLSAPLSAPLIPLSAAPTRCWCCCCKRKMCAGLHAVCSIRGRAAVQALAEKKHPSSPSTGHAMVPAYSYRHGSLHGHSSRRAPEPLRASKGCVRQPTKGPLEAHLRTRALAHRWGPRDFKHSDSARAREGEKGPSKLN